MSFDDDLTTEPATDAGATRPAAADQTDEELAEEVARQTDSSAPTAEQAGKRRDEGD